MPRRLSPWKALGALAFAFLLLDPGPVAAQDPLRWSQNLPGNSKPITLYADDVCSWVDQGNRVILLKGRAWVEQGFVHIHLKQGVVWVDEEQNRRTSIYHVDLYGEGDVTLEDGPKTLTGARALLELNTRGEIRVKSYRGKVVQTPALADPLFLRGVAMKHNLGQAGNPTRSAPQGSTEKPATAAPATAQSLEQRLSGYQSGVLPPPPPSPAQAVQRTVAVEPVPAGAPPGSPADPAPPAGPMSITPEQPGATGPPGLPPSNMQPGGPGPVPMSAPGSLFPGPTSAQPYPPPGPTFSPAQGPMTVPPPPTPVAPPAPATAPPPAKVAPPPPGNGPPRVLTIRPRYSQPFAPKADPLPDGYTAVVINTGIILTVSNADGKNGILDIEADRFVMWTKQNNTQDLLDKMRSPQGQESRSLEFYLAGNVEIRTRQGKDERLLRAAEVYYDVNRNVAIALQADLEIKQPFLADVLHVKAQEMQQLNAKLSHVIRAEVYSSKLPSDPGLKLVVSDGDLEEKEVPKKSIFGRQVISRATGQPEIDKQEIFTGRNAFLDLGVVSDLYAPLFYWPWFRADVRDPLGPLESLGFNYNRIFGFQFLSTFDVYDLLGIDRVVGTRWKLHVDYLTQRGPALGTDYDFAGKDLFDIPGHYAGNIKAYGIYDTGRDILGGNRGESIFNSPFDVRAIHHPWWRGRLSGIFNWLDLPEGFTVQARTFVLSDRNYMEQFFLNEYLNGPEEETSVYVKQQQGTWAWTALVEPRLRDWMTETEFLPKVDGYLLGQKWFGLFTYNVRGDATFAHLRPADQPPPDDRPPPFQFTQANVETGRFDIFQELSLPFTFGPFKLVPYATLDLTYYTQALDGSDRARFYGGGGIRGSIPFSRLYPDIQSELLNLDGIYHKIVISGNFYTAHSDTSFLRLPQLDALQDVNSNKALRDFYPLAPYVNPNGLLLATSPLFNPQLYAIRTLVDNRIDTLDSIEVFVLDVRQRWQTKRGYPGQEHIIDWMTLDVATWFYPRSQRDDFGETLGLITYDWAWNVGDRTSLFSTGLFEPIETGARAYSVGVSYNRPDRTTFVFSYRQIDPVNSKAILASATYAFSPKYAITATTLYDFGIHNYYFSTMLTRIGTDLQLNVGVSYNTLLNNFGFQLELVPNVVPANRRGAPGTGGIGSSLLSQR
jgi:hypothetical protein